MRDGGRRRPRAAPCGALCHGPSAGMPACFQQFPPPNGVRKRSTDPGEATYEQVIVPCAPAACAGDGAPKAASLAAWLVPAASEAGVLTRFFTQQRSKVNCCSSLQLLDSMRQQPPRRPHPSSCPPPSPPQLPAALATPAAHRPLTTSAPPGRSAGQSHAWGPGGQKAPASPQR